MKITPFNGPSAVKAYKFQAKNNAGAKSESEKSPGVNVEFSQRAKEISQFSARLKKIPAVREEKVQDLKQRINNQTYKPCAEKIAQGILRERRLDELV
ncbi:negative regulator of flagellin synthesis FlgM [Desulfohalotomaculum tongense]|uniref:flagellar biosynthesis anti-sigma factor FlgM n=1 Tax=Desulforadius tongensis TaxID=1216062 RepID=UPI0019577364|nr:flagellar biosynthesis anti-sigma factor FlgM [Desulforadius tongensis]MBM7856057.1 negative regulator of flagellin synthesis FlgM [Desulforadius tongensis]